jgi:hypothetical protein
MAKIRIMQIPRDLAREVAFQPTLTPIVRPHLERYLVLPPMEVAGEGQAAADEVFDLTNNPSRQDERLERYGNGKSLSVGDIVQVYDGPTPQSNIKFLCASFGWEVV